MEHDYTLENHLQESYYYLDEALDHLNNAIERAKNEKSNKNLKAIFNTLFNQQFKINKLLDKLEN